ncbi:MAG TPA: class II glutamine amidotransferase [Polyangiaceae bacterium]|jgi:glutamine amidotransferase|nr:class II glutamine amidotransferase [Polyangiaceae bacterium]
MCRLLGVVASRPVDHRTLLAERTRSLAALGEEHRDGWGLAAASGGRWRIDKGTRPASRDARFRERALSSSGEILVSHVRKRTVGPIRKTNAHPFSCGRWVFAHNGTVQDRAWIAARTSPARAAEIRGETDSEAFFAFVLTRLDEAGVTSASAKTDDVLARTLAECRAREGFGSFNFLLSDGASVYAHRFGRSLYVLERTGDRRASSVFIASEAMTDEPWREVDSGTLLRVSVAGERRWTAP